MDQSEQFVPTAKRARVPFTGWKKWFFLVADAIREIEEAFPNASGVYKLNSAVGLVLDRAGLDPVRSAAYRVVLRWVIDRLAPGLVEVFRRVQQGEVLAEIEDEI